MAFLMKYPKRTFLAVLGDDDSFWLCRANQHVYGATQYFSIQWLELIDEESGTYVLNKDLHGVSVHSVLTDICLIALKRGKFRLPKRQKRKIVEELRLVKPGTATVEEKEGEKLKPGRKRKAASAERGGATKRKKDADKATKTGPAKKRNQREKKKKDPKPPKAKKPKKEKPKKVPKKRGPNSRLKPNPNVTVWERDPLFESKESIPFVSSTAHSKLAIRAILLNDMALLKKCKEDYKQVHSLNVKRSMAVDLDPLQYAVKMNNLEAVKILQEREKHRRVGTPVCMMENVGTGTYNYRSLGVRNIRRLNMSRGGREGNNALVKDVSNIYAPNDLDNLVTEWGIPLKRINELTEMKVIHGVGDIGIIQAVRQGNVDLAAHFIKEDLKKLSIGSLFNHFHHEALLWQDEKWEPGTREASVRKQGPAGLTPMHCACTNKHDGPLRQLFAICPDVNIADSNQRKLVHYAAVSNSLSTMQHLIDNGANLEDIDKEGITPLMVASKAGKAHMVEFIIATLKDLREKDPNPLLLKKLGIGGIDKPSKNSWSAIHYAVEGGHIDVMKVLLKFGVKVERQLNIAYDKRTPLMMAAAAGDLEMVKVLLEFAKIQKFDRYKRTALTHAVMNGSANIASLFLRLGANPQNKDTSGNTDLHYACAYGWYFCMKVLLEAGAELNAPNDWRLIPVAVAFLKGHTGIGKYLLQQPGVEINFVDDDGRTIVLKIIAEAKELTSEMFLDLKDMIERRGADPLVKDNNGRNALHYLCQHDPCNTNIDESSDITAAKKTFESQLSLHIEFVHYFISKGCSCLDMDKQGNLPFSTAMERSIDGIKKNYQLVYYILDMMKNELSSLSSLPDEDPIGKIGPNLLCLFASHVNIWFIEEEEQILSKLKMVLELICAKAPGATMEDFVERRGMDYKTALIMMCQAYANSSSLRWKEYRHLTNFTYHLGHLKWGTDTQGKYLQDRELKWARFRDMIKHFIHDFNAKVTYTVALNPDSLNDERTYTVSTLDMLSRIQNEPCVPFEPIFDMMFEFDQNIDARDAQGLTPLIHALRRNDDVLAKKFITLGADINQVFDGGECKYVDEEAIKLKSTPLIEVTKRTNLAMVRHLLSLGADKNLANAYSLDKSGEKHFPCSLFRIALDICKNDRRSKAKLALLKEIIKSGVNVNEVDKNNRNAFHHAINESTDSADQNLDLEITLLRSKCDVLTKDSRGRLPLHYTFVKIGRHTQNHEIDPIEVCSMLVQAMEGKSIDQPDVFGQTPLHYAAFRGASVCCLLLLAKGADINAVDNRGNTPLAYAVLGHHQGCCLTLLQKGANVNIDVHPDTERVPAWRQTRKPRFKCLPQHFEEEEARKKTSYTFFQGVVQNSWLGVTYVALDEMEAYGMCYASAIEVAIHTQKFQFAKTLIAKQVSEAKLREKVSNGKNLITALAFEATWLNDLQEDIMDLLHQAGLSLTDRDDDGNTALHYACMKQNLALVNLLLGYDGPAEVVNYQNNFGVTPLGAIFWQSGTSGDRVSELLDVILEQGGCSDVLIPFKQMSYQDEGFVPTCRNRKDFYETNSKHTSPLILAIIHRAYKIIEKLISKGCDVNFADDEGMTPLMHAVKTNDIEIVHQLFHGQGKRRLHLDASSALITTFIDVNAADKNGKTVLHHLIELPDDKGSGDFKASFDNAQMLELLLSAGVQATREALNRAEELGARETAKKLGTFFPKKHLAFGMSDHNMDETDFRPPRVNDRMELAWSSPFDYDVKEDALKMLKELEVQADRKAKRANCNGPSNGERNCDMEEDDEEDSDSESTSDSEEEDCRGNSPAANQGPEDKPPGCIVVDGAIYDGHTILMTKIDVSYGAWGLYNFYRMQLWKESRKDLWILFTNWGRIGESNSGQYQNTPFSSADKAVEEFQKIFKAKSGNEWAQRDSFENKPNKYRPVKVEFIQPVRREALKFDLTSDIPSKLTKDVQDVVKDLANVNMYIDVYRRLGSDNESVPFGRIKRSNVEKAREILGQLAEKIAEKDEIEEERRKGNTAEIQSALADCLHEISRLSSEYYYLMPKGGFEFTRLQPIDDESARKQELECVDYTLELEVAERLLLAAQYRRRELHPLDYIYRALGCQIEALDPEDDAEVPYLLQYMYNSSEAGSLNVEGVYRVRRPCEDATFRDFLAGQSGRRYRDDRRLLWHGTKAANLLSILKNGLLVNPPFAPITGKAFGNGIYTSDSFGKSYGYAFDWRRGGRDAGSSKYMMLCDTALGRCKEIIGGGDRSAFPPAGYDSVLVEASARPDPLFDLRVKAGWTIPFGRDVTGKRMLPNDRCFLVNRREFVTYSEPQTAVRYIIKIEA